MTPAGSERRLPRAAIALLAGCAGPGTWQIDGLEDVAELGSAVWIVEQGETSTEHRLLLSSAPDACDALQEGTRALAGLKGEPDDDCAAFQTAMADAGEALDGVVGAGAVALEIRLEGAPSAGTWSTADPDGEDVGPTFEGTLRRFDENPYAWAATEYDCFDPDPLSEYTAELMEEDRLEPATLTLDDVRARVSEGSLTGTFNADEDGDLIAIGSVDAEVRWSRCEVEASEDPAL